MTLDTTLSLDVVISIIVLLGAVWRLDSKIDGMRKELKVDIQGVRDELKDDIGSVRNDFKDDIRELKGEMQGVRARVDNVAERLARLEGKLDVREDLYEAEPETDPAA